MEKFDQILHLVHIGYAAKGLFEKPGNVGELTRRIQGYIQSIVDNPLVGVNFVDEYHYPENKKLDPHYAMLNYILDNQEGIFHIENWEKLVRKPANDENRRQEIFDYSVKLLGEDRVMSSFANEGVNNHDFIKQIFLEQINGRMKRGFLGLGPNTKHVVAGEYFNLCTSGWIKALIAFGIREKDIFLNPYLSLLYHKARGNKKNYREIYHKDCVH